MPKALTANYKRNIEILKENLRRGLDVQNATKTIDAMEDQFIHANLYGTAEKDFINEMRGIVIEHVTGIEVRSI